MSANATTVPVVDAIAYERSGRPELVERAAHALARGDQDGARVVLLCDQDDWWPFDLPTPADARRALEAPTLRGAMDALGYGPVGDYFAFRWSDPTFLSGLGLLEAHLAAAGSLFELGCGIGHLLREAELRGVAPLGADVVWSKLWLCRRFVCPSARLWCFDAADPFPLGDGSAEVALCHDALHYLPDPGHAVAELRRVGGRVLVGHAHNAAADNLSPGSPLDTAGWAALLPTATLYDDAELGRALLRGDASQVPARTAQELAGAPVLALAEPAHDGVAHGPSFADPVPGATLRLNPLLDPVTLEPRWPSRRYEEEYAALSDHLTGAPSLRGASEAARARQRILLDLPAAW